MRETGYQSFRALAAPSRSCAFSCAYTRVIFQRGLRFRLESQSFFAQATYLTFVHLHNQLPFTMCQRPFNSSIICYPGAPTSAFSFKELQVCAIYLRKQTAQINRGNFGRPSVLCASAPSHTSVISKGFEGETIKAGSRQSTNCFSTSADANGFLNSKRLPLRVAEGEHAHRCPRALVPPSSPTARCG